METFAELTGGSDADHLHSAQVIMTVLCKQWITASPFFDVGAVFRSMGTATRSERNVSGEEQSFAREESHVSQKAATQVPVKAF